MSALQITFKQAKHYTPANREPKLIVLHTAEVSESLEGAESLMNACARGLIYPPGHPKAGQPNPASWHYSVDANSICQSVHDWDVAHHAPGANRTGVGIELCGRARQTPAEWQDDYSFYVMENAAKLSAHLSTLHNIPLVFVPREVLKLPGATGVTTHLEVSKAFGKSDHWDPGPHFPMPWFLQRAVHFRSLPNG